MCTTLLSASGYLIQYCFDYANIDYCFFLSLFNCLLILTRSYTVCVWEVIKEPFGVGGLLDA